MYVSDKTRAARSLAMSLRPRGVGGRVLKKDEQPPPPPPPKPPKPILVEGPQPRVRGKFVKKARVKPAPPPPPIEPGSKYITHYTLGVIDSNYIYEPRPDLRERFMNPIVAREIALPILDKIQEVRGNRSFKLQFSYHVQSSKNGEDYLWYIHTHATEIVLQATTKAELWEMIQHLLNVATARTEEHVVRGSGWVINYLKNIEFNMYPYDPLRAGSYKPLPTWLSKKRAIQNIQNTDDMCFKWAVIAGVFPNAGINNREKVSSYKKLTHPFDFGDEWPMPINRICRFESRNKDFSINVFGLDDDEKSIVPLRLSKNRHGKYNIDLFWYDDHYSLVVDLGRLINTQISKEGHKKHMCRFCLHAFKFERGLIQHNKDGCGADSPVRMPAEGSFTKWDELRNYKKQIKLPFVIYADFEAICKQLERKGKNTEKIQEQEACSYGYQITSIWPEHQFEPRQYRGPNAVVEFIQQLQKDGEMLGSIIAKTQPLEWQDGQEAAHNAATHCHICTKVINENKVADHDHMYGTYRGAAHLECNSIYTYKKEKIPVVFHNLRGYDAHHIIQNIAEAAKSKKIDTIAINKEKFISFSFDNFRFIDSCSFMMASLDSLSANLLASNGPDSFNYFNKVYNGEPDLLRKGIYPYDYMDSTARFEETNFPKIEDFNSILRNEGIKPEEYEHGLHIYKKFGCRNLGDYHDIYLKTDVLLLADVFEEFRNVCLKIYGLDPAWYYTAPGLSWDALLKHTGIELELLTDLNKYTFCEQAKRGGICMASIKKMDSTPDQQLKYYDANNLYGWAMMQPLPTSNFTWTTNEWEMYMATVHASIDDPIGYTVEVDIEYPEELHDLHNDYPLAPESLVIGEESLSPYQKANNLICQTKHTGCQKLVPNLRNKTNYKVHYRTLQLYMQLGLKVSKWHRALKFEQKPWMASYIQKNTDLRAASKNDFEKDFFKLMNNSVFGKTMEDVRNRANIEIIIDEKLYVKRASSPRFMGRTFVGEKLRIVESQKPSIKLNKPIYVGAAVLDLSKLLMYDFYYNKVKKRMPNVRCGYTDTDSLMLIIPGEEDRIYKEMGLDDFDTSNLPKDHPYYSKTNNKVVGKFKDEWAGRKINQIIAVRSKVYSILSDDDQTKKLKGVRSNVEITHENYLKCCISPEKEDMLQTITQHSLLSKNHVIHLVEQKKTSLSNTDDKRYHTSPTESLAHGHYRAQAQIRQAADLKLGQLLELFAV